jgi:hypothetical protein
MKLSDKTLTILENFSKISSSAFFFPGKTQKVMTPAKSIYAQADFDEEFPIEFGIYDLTKFLSVLSLFNNPELEFDAKFVTIKNDSSEATFWFTPKDLISNAVVDPSKSIKLNAVDLAFGLSKEDYKYLKSSASVMGLPNFIIEGDGKSINLLVKDADTATSNKMSKRVGETTDTFEFVGDISNLRMLDDDYDVQVSKKGIIEFTSKNNSLKYWVAIRK